MELASKRKGGFWRIPVSRCVVAHQRFGLARRWSSSGLEGLGS